MLLKDCKDLYLFGTPYNAPELGTKVRDVERVSSIVPQCLQQGIELVIIGHRETQEEEDSWWLNVS